MRESGVQIGNPGYRVCALPLRCWLRLGRSVGPVEKSARGKKHVTCSANFSLSVPCARAAPLLCAVDERQRAHR
jgi:hypothetical protein